MPTHGYAARRPSRLVLAGILGGHAAILAALMLIKTVYLPAPPIKPLDTYEVPREQPPLPEPPPPDAKEPAKTQAPVTTVVPRVIIPMEGPVVQRPPDEIVDFRPVLPAPETRYAEAVTPTLPPPEPPAAFIPPKPRPVAVKPRGNPGGWVTNEDYPAAALRNEEQGRTAFRLDIGADGRPTACSITASSGSAALDGAACRLLMRRAKFVPGRDEDGVAVGGTYANSFRWQIPEG